MEVLLRDTLVPGELYIHHIVMRNRDLHSIRSRWNEDVVEGHNGIDGIEAELLDDGTPMIHSRGFASVSLLDLEEHVICKRTGVRGYYFEVRVLASTCRGLDGASLIAAGSMKTRDVINANLLLSWRECSLVFPCDADDDAGKAIIHRRSYRQFQDYQGRDVLPLGSQMCTHIHRRAMLYLSKADDRYMVSHSFAASGPYAHKDPHESESLIEFLECHIVDEVPSSADTSDIRGLDSGFPVQTDQGEEGPSMGIPRQQIASDTRIIETSDLRRMASQEFCERGIESDKAILSGASAIPAIRVETDGHLSPMTEWGQPHHKSSPEVMAQAQEDLVEAADSCAQKKYLCFDARGCLRGACSCGNCDSWGRGNSSDASSDATQTSAGTDFHQKLDLNEVCRHCGCLASRHRDLQPWLKQVQARVKHFRATGATTHRALPVISRLPVEALDWAMDDVALYVLTSGRFDPAAHQRPLKTSEMTEDPLVSVCVPTIGKRHCFHPLLYHNFLQQDHKHKEMVVVDTGECPSKFLQECARADERVIYRYFNVEDAKEDAKDESDEEIRHCESWSLGLKRNIAVTLARGPIICHFDDDDMYAADYISFMLEQLFNRVANIAGFHKAAMVRRGQYPAIATLSEWHMLDMDSMTFRYMDPKRETMPEEWRIPMIYGYGFSYVFTRAAWKMQAFPDTETSEDDIFMDGLLQKQVPVVLVRLPSDRSGIVSHNLHGGCTSGGEFNKNKRLGFVVSTPGAFKGHLPIARQATKDLPLAV